MVFPVIAYEEMEKQKSSGRSSEYAQESDPGIEGASIKKGSKQSADYRDHRILAETLLPY